MRSETKEEKRSRIHDEQAERGWLQPTPLFKTWWEPNGYNPKSGAQTGGHREAYRKCVKPDTGEIRFYGVKTIVAFNTPCYRDEFHHWLKDGMPEREVLEDGTAATTDKQIALWKQIKTILKDSPLASSVPEA